MKILRVGAGAVGVSYGYALARGGAEIGFFVKQAHVASLKGGVNVYPLRRKSVRLAERLSGFGLLTTPDEVRAAGPWDQVWLCVSSPALGGPWLPPLLEALDDGTVVVVLQPGSGDLDLVRGLHPPNRLVSKVITLVAFQTPLPGDPPHEPGIAVWLPPLAAFPVSGPRDAALPVVEALRRGGWRAQWAGAAAKSGGGGGIRRAVADRGRSRRRRLDDRRPRPRWLKRHSDPASVATRRRASAFSVRRS